MPLYSLSTYDMSDNKVLVLRTCANDMSDHAGQVWPDAGLVVCKHWKPSKKLENGLVGLLWGEGSSTQLSLRADAKWVVCEVHIDQIIKLDEDGMIKFPEAEVVHTGTQDSSINYIAAHIEHYQSANIP